jgi:hypothetical protein
MTYGCTHALRDGVLIEDFHHGLERDLSPAEPKCCQRLNALTTCFRNVFRDGPPPFLRQSPIGDLTVWAVLGYHGSRRFVPELAPTVYAMRAGGSLSPAPPRRQVLMTALALMNMAAHHEEMGDRVIGRACLMRAIKLMIKRAAAQRLGRKGLRQGFRRLNRKLRGRSLRRGHP